MEPNQSTNVINAQGVQADPADVEKNKTIAALAYILFFIPLLAAKDSKFAMYHANQGLILFLAGIVGWVLSSVLSVVGIGCLLMPLVTIAWIVYVIIGIMNAYNGKMEPLPLIGNFELLK